MRLLLLAAAAFLPIALCFDYTIAVGRDEVTGLPGVGFAPSRTVTSSGANDVLVFRFQQGEHNVIESTFDAPCSPAGTFSTGLVTVANTTANSTAITAGPVFTYPIANSSVVAYFYDGGNGGRNCLQGAVFCLNVDENICLAHRRAALALGAAAGVPTSIRSNSAFVAPSTSMSSTRTRATASTTRSVAASAVVMGGAGRERAGGFLGVVGVLVGLAVGV